MMRVLAGVALLLVLTTAQPAAAQSSWTVPIRPAPGFRSAGQVRVLTSADGGLQISVAVQGPPEEVSRDEAGRLVTNFIWHIVTGTCEAWMESSGAGTSAGQILLRFIEPPTGRDSLAFQRTIPLSELSGAEGQPLALVAFRNGGGGPLYACADLSRSRAPTSLPVTGIGGAHPQSERSGKARAIAMGCVMLLLVAGALRMRQHRRRE